MLNRGGRVMLWRWRRNPLRRCSDVVEAWLGVVAAAMLLLAAPAVAFAVAAVAENALLDQAQGLRPVAARLVKDVPVTLSRFAGEAGDNRVSASVRWTTSTGSSRSGTASVEAGSEAGTLTEVWLDEADRVHPAPLTPAEARSQGTALGVAAAASVCVLVLGGWWVARVRLDVRRRAQWDRAWAEFDAHRGHRHA
ncbi:Rv1733c family protein [Streptomyces sporangiiformans]|uniref:Transmembrane protein n=1 Tax=Streptomyces sporangiiformans TaxID=2315329 RepID=A0A505D684_9ACTN|nr:hypothetical protein [Streptomyces sporangiiformans]TPQ17752.1 hypothetical protein FGD71_034350 [Streptomyces sporangiiformans]